MRANACTQFISATVAGLALMAALSASTAMAQIEADQFYDIRVLADNSKLRVDKDNILSVSNTNGNTSDTFQFIDVGEGFFQIKAGGRTRLHENGRVDRLISTRYADANDDFTKFKLHKQQDGSYRIEVKATNRFWHTNGLQDKLVSTRWQADDKWTRFKISPVGVATPQPAEPNLIRTGVQFYLFECTKGEYMAASDVDANVLRWSRTNKDDQKWELVSATGGKYHFKSLLDDKYLNIQGFTGNASISTPRQNNSEQVFTIETVSEADAAQIIPDDIRKPFQAMSDYCRQRNLPRPFEYIRIKESTRDELVSVGSNGNILRWKPTNEASQIFVYYPVAELVDGENAAIHRAAVAAKFANDLYEQGVGSSGQGVDLLTLQDFMQRKSLRLNTLLGDDSSSWQGTVYRNFTEYKLNFVVLSNANRAYISFVGTKNDENWRLNGNVLQGGTWINKMFAGANCQPISNVPNFEGAYVHYGWATAANLIFPTIVEELNRQNALVKDVTITGHSLGGALAGHTAYLLMASNKVPAARAVDCVTFGAPQYASFSFRSLFQRQQNRYPLMKSYALDITEDGVVYSWRDYLIVNGTLAFGITNHLSALPDVLGIRANRDLNNVPNHSDNAHDLNNYYNWATE